MRVAIITENFLPKLDGVTRTVSRLLEHLHTNGHQALLLGPECGMDEYAGAEVVGTAGLPFPFYPELKFNFFRPLFVRRLIEFRPDIIHVVDPVILGATGLAAARLLNIPIISSYHTNLAAYCGHFGFSLLTRPMWLYNRFVHNQCALTFCPSASTASMLTSQGFEHLRIWPRGVEKQLFQSGRRSESLRAEWLRERSVPEDKTILLYVGRVSWEKNLRLLIQAYREMDHSRCHLVIVGQGPAFNEIQQDLSQLPVTMTGYLSGEALATAYASADVFAFPSYTETFGQVVLEAMSSGLPVVGVRSEGVCDLVKHGQTGLLLDAATLSEQEQVAGYRQYLDRLILNAEERKHMGQLAESEAAQRSWHEAMECMVQGYRDVVARSQVLIAA
ncbi:glycosyltransferase family 4 protein [Dictyobacter kobayashii]|uniref:Glycosyl transferase family 1 n=1 Tax=Dictyobacter kobayashii TaxID=2014872 RepID=A0A402AG75_9CHLR|nr:glycosyltransferase family 1 protein [Dictyobacter kobayashii]GCE18117.1 glycosyl transferase family 1 [Dictyobacter kobayashii]